MIEGIGLTFGELIASIAAIGSVIYAWTNINIRVKGIEVRVDSLELGRKQNAEAIQRMHIENREDHKEIINTINKLVDKINE